MNYKLSPSDLTYLFEGCKYCFSLKVKHNITQPSMPMPGIFTAIAGRQKEFYAGKKTKEFSLELPLGIVEYGEKWVESVPIKIEGSTASCYIKGRFDMVVKFDDGSYGVIDCKTARPSDKKTEMYGRQLQAYTYALENPATGALSLTPVTRLGILYFEPNSFEQFNLAEQSFRGNLIWHEVLRNDTSFLNFIKTVAKILESNEIFPHTCQNCEYCKQGKSCLAGKKEASENGCTCCQWCKYRFQMKELDSSVSAALKDLSFKEIPPCPQCGGLMSKKVGKYGEFLSCDRYPECKGTRKIL